MDNQITLIIVDHLESFFSGYRFSALHLLILSKHYLEFNGNITINKTGLQHVSNPVEQIPIFSKSLKNNQNTSVTVKVKFWKLNEGGQSVGLQILDFINCLFNFKFPHVKTL